MIVLDTHAWLCWLHDPAQLSARARRLITAEAARDGGLAVSAISIWEVAVKAALGKLTLPLDVHTWFAQARSYPGTAIVPVDAEDAIASTLLPGELHRDPADRIIVALARRLGVPLVTRDRRILAYPHVQTTW